MPKRPGHHKVKVPNLDSTGKWITKLWRTVLTGHQETVSAFLQSAVARLLGPLSMKKNEPLINLQQLLFYHNEYRELWALLTVNDV